MTGPLTNPFRRGDRVQVTETVPDVDVCRGELGTVVAVDLRADVAPVCVKFDDGRAWLEPDVLTWAPTTTREIDPHAEDSRLLPRRWRRRVAAVWRADDGIDIIHRATTARLAAVMPDGDGAWVCADGNMVTRWYTRRDAVLYGAESRQRARGLTSWRLRRLLRIPTPDLDQCPGEIADWTDDARWSALFDSTVWDPAEVER